MSWLWLTGATGGLGRALAEQYARQGQSLLLSARDPKALAELAASLPGQHQCLAFDLLDLQQPEQRQQLLQALLPYVQQGISMAIFNAGQSQRSFVLQTQVEVEQRLMWINFHAPAILSRLLLPYLLQQDQPSQLVYVSSMAGRLGSPGRAGYSAAKHALTGWVDSLRQELVGQPVRVRLLSPDFIATGIAKAALTGDGTAYGKLDAEIAHGLSAQQMAESMCKALASKQDDIRLCGAKVRLADWIYRLNPEWYHLLLARFYRRDF